MNQYRFTVTIQHPHDLGEKTHRDTVRDFIAVLLSHLSLVEAFDIVEVKE